MNDFIETLWSQFSIETEEHIESIELNLVQAEQSGATPEIISSLFRAFHSLKGLANAMDMVSFARVAHRAEDILGVIRDGTFPLNSDAVSLLLQALDEIKVLQREAVASQRNGEVSPVLMQNLTNAISSMGISTAAPDPGAPPAPAGEDQLLQAETAPPVIPLHEDPVMLSYFLELARENIPTLSGILDVICSSPGTLGSNEYAEYISRTGLSIDRLAHAARVMEFHRLAATLEHLRSALPTHPPITEEQRNIVTDCLRQLHDQILLLEESTGTPDAGAGQLFNVLKEAMESNLQSLFKVVLNDLDALQHTCGEANDQHLAETLHASLAALSSNLTFFLQNSTSNVVLMLEDVFGRAARGELHIFNEIIELARDEINHVFENYRSWAREKPCLTSLDDISLSIQKIHEYIWAYESGSGTSNPLEAFRRFMSSLNISQELLQILSPENVRDLMRSLEQGEHVYELLAHLESDEQLAGRFLEWIGQSGSRVITNRSVFIDRQSWYEMLIVSPHGRSDVEKRLRAIDPAGTLLLLKSGDESIPQKTALLKALDEAPATTAAAASSTMSGNVIRVRGEMLDNFMNQIGEMVLARSRLNHIVHNERLTMLITRLKQQKCAAAVDSAELLDILEEHRRALSETDQFLNNALGHLQQSAVGLRVVPIETVYKRLPRIVRDLAQLQGKRVNLDLNGQDVKIDKAMVEVLADPLLHMVRNSMDHGIEPPGERETAGKPPEGLIRISARQQGNSIIIDITDDGRGIDTDKVLQKALERGLVQDEAARALSREEILRFIFLPGFSTAALVTETSGRGVGMDVVMTNVMRMGGAISIESQAKRGSTFTLKMPLSAAIQEVLMVETAGQTLALPGRYVSEVIEINGSDLQSIQGEEAILLRGSFLPLHHLAGLLGYRAPARVDGGGIAVVLSNSNQRIGIVVDRVLRRQELFTKDIQDTVAALPGVGGASILGNGRVVLILDGEDLLRMAKAGRRNGTC